MTPDARALAQQRALAVDAARDRVRAPVAHVAGDAADAYGEAVEQALARAADYARAEQEGLLLREVPLEAIDLDHLERDRCAVDADALDELGRSIAAHGLRTPIEVMPCPGDAERFALISGRRRVLALQALFAANREARFATARALVRPTLSVREAYVAMVEENDVRADLSFYERGRIAVVIAERGFVADVGEAVDTLFAAASPAKRSKVRSFARIHEALGDLLAHPTTLGERLGLKLAEALRRDGVEPVRTALLKAGPFVDAAAEREALAAVVEAPTPAAGAAPELAPRRRGRPRRTPPPTTRVELRAGVQLERRELEDRVEIRVFGPGVDAAVADRIAAAVHDLLGGEGGGAGD